jgi:hypothetical protein
MEREMASSNELTEHLKNTMLAANDAYVSGYNEGLTVGYDKGFAAGIAHAQKLINETLPRELFEVKK